MEETEIKRYELPETNINQSIGQGLVIQKRITVKDLHRIVMKGKLLLICVSGTEKATASVKTHYIFRSGLRVSNFKKGD